ncbi:MAG: sodium/proton-translocating pyrophosphatase [Armatimonadetes bacterium]|nr:sodium/proton-translocating pyrophosphatase [Armatimonadota bacterium]MBS1712031.1 sodium/proton-translocating pyrophosphatase [Armatimonadota bacterium]
MLGGMNPSQLVKTNQLVASNINERNNAEAILRAASDIAAKQKKEVYEVSADDVFNAKEIQALKMVDALMKQVSLEDTADNRKLAEDEVKSRITQTLAGGQSAIPAEQDFKEYKSVKPGDKGNLVNNYAVMMPAATPTSPTAQPEPTYATLGDLAKDGKVGIYKISVSVPATDAQGKPDPTKAPRKQSGYVGVMTRQALDDTIKQFETQSPGTKLTVEKEYPATIFANKEGKVIAGIDADPKEVNLSFVQPLPGAMGGAAQFGFAAPVEKVKAYNEKVKADPAKAGAAPPSLTPQLAYIKHKTAHWWQFLACVALGLVMAFVFEALTDYYVGLHKRPVQELGQVSTAGPAPMIITGFAYGQESSVFSVFAIVACLMGPLLIFPPAEYGGYILSFYGIALVGLGLLTTTGFILAMDTFGPISDNSQGVFEMSGAHHDSPDGARRVQLLDAAGNTTKALTKGFAIATAVVAAVALFHAYVEEGQLTAVGMRLEIPEIFLGLLIGGAAPYLFSAFSINAVGRAAFELINEVRAQFRNDAGIMAGTSKPNYAKCVAIVTKAAQTELLGPGILAIFFPVLVGFGFSIGKPMTMINGVEYNLVGAQALGGFLAGTILSGQLMAVLLANSGGMWDNAKKLIEDGLHGGKGTEAHKAAVVCDTVGDPFKDTAGPALNPLIKVMNLVALLLAPAVIAKRDSAVLIGITLFAAAMLIVAIWWSKRGGMGTGMAAAEGADPNEGQHHLESVDQPVMHSEAKVEEPEKE